MKRYRNQCPHGFTCSQCEECTRGDLVERGLKRGHELHKKLEESELFDERLCKCGHMAAMHTVRSRECTTRDCACKCFEASTSPEFVDLDALNLDFGDLERRLLKQQAQRESLAVVEDILRTLGQAPRTSRLAKMTHMVIMGTTTTGKRTDPETTLERAAKNAHARHGVAPSKAMEYLRGAMSNTVDGPVNIECSDDDELRHVVHYHVDTGVVCCAYITLHSRQARRNGYVGFARQLESLVDYIHEHVLPARLRW